MQFGECPYDCGHYDAWETPDAPLPVLERITCEGCGKTIYLYHSRYKPSAYTEEGLAEAFDINHETKSVKRKDSSNEI